ncbi:MAG: fibrobacter succinogenes major paralogous domain-containing protein, partial [Saprospiraceae bacterium]
GKYWMLKNLVSTKFRNGDPIPYVYQAEWKDIPKDSAAYCTFGDSMVLTSIYGHLYNWYAVKDPRGLAPIGWHVPTEEEWKRLVDCNGGEEVAGARLKEAGSAHWKSGAGNNASGFTALPGSRRLDVPNPDLGIVAVFWTSMTTDSCSTVTTPYFATHDAGDNAYSNCGNNRFGFSVRCVRDE